MMPTCSTRCCSVTEGYNTAAGALALADARAEAIRREAEALKGNPALIQLRLAEQWDGKLPQVSGGGAIPLLNIDGLNNK
jgi:hypothetical protein